VGLVTWLEAPADKSPDQVRWALLADLHVPADPAKEHLGVYPDRQVREVVPQLVAAHSQAALIAGDLAWDQGLPEDYRRLRQMLEPLREQFAICLMPGNHDNRAAMLREFGRAGLENPEAVEKTVTVCEHGPIRWILLDSLYRTDVVPGLLGEAQRQWLQGFLDSADPKPTLLCVHHPLGEQDDRLLDSDRLLRIVQPAPMVKAIFTAHDHVYRLETECGIPVVGLPALGMPFRPVDPTGWLEAELSGRGATLTFHAVGPNTLGDGERTELQWR
jgi:3',5'-cyclic AMP phosphodiesterase CpdA